MRRYNFQRVRNRMEMAEGVAVHAEDLEAAAIKAHRLMANHYPPDDHIRFVGNEPCVPAERCGICEKASMI